MIFIIIKIICITLINSKKLPHHLFINKINKHEKIINWRLFFFRTKTWPWSLKYPWTDQFVKECKDEWDVTNTSQGSYWKWTYYTKIIDNILRNDKT